MAITKGAGLDFMKERATAARHPEISIIGTKLLLTMLTRLLVLALKPASLVAATPKTSGVNTRKAKAQNNRALTCSEDRVSFGKVFIWDSPFVDEWVNFLD